MTPKARSTIKKIRDYNDRISQVTQSSRVAQTQLADQQARSARDVLARGSLDEEVKFLVQKAADDAALGRQLNAQLSTFGSYPNFSRQPFWRYSILTLFGAGLLAWLITFLSLRFIGHRPESIFLLGDGIERQQAIDKRREKIVWSLGVSLIIGIASSVLAAVLLGV